MDEEGRESTFFDVRAGGRGAEGTEEVRWRLKHSSFRHDVSNFALEAVEEGRAFGEGIVLIELR